MPIEVVVGDIDKLRDVQVIVNAANTNLVNGHGVCGAIFKAAGEEHMRMACEHIGGCPTGKAVATPAFNLISQGIIGVIHAVGPRYADHEPDVAAFLLHSAYLSSLQLVAKEGIKSIAFPSISTGIYGYPVQEAAEIAIATIKSFLMLYPSMRVIICVWPDNYEIYKKLVNSTVAA